MHRRIYIHRHCVMGTLFLTYTHTHTGEHISFNTRKHAKAQHACSSLNPAHLCVIHACSSVHHVHALPYMHEVCSTACICGLTVFIVCLERPHYILAVFISMGGHAHAVRGLIPVQHPLLLAPRSYRLFRVHSSIVRSQPLQDKNQRHCSNGTL